MISVTTPSNYLARIVALPAPRKHSNADKLACVSILGNNIITGLTAKEGELYVYFPLECAINKDFLTFTNSFVRPEDNADGKSKGFFEKHGRVRALRLRGERSEGYIVPISSINNWLEYLGSSEFLTEKHKDQDFDTINGIILCEKYVNRQVLIDAEKAARQEGKRNKKAVRASKLIENQYRLSPDTEALKRNIDRIKPDDIITITYKYHGANISFGRVLCKKPLNLWDKVGKFLGFNVVDTQYDLVYASRRVVKNKYADKQADHYYDTDVWGEAVAKYKECLKDGITIYGELIGFTSTGAPIQKGYDYGLVSPQNDIIVYRITQTNYAGDVFEFSTRQITEYCKKFGLKRAEVFYHGPAKDLFDIPVEDIRTWQDTFLQKLMDKYLEKDCHICKNKVPAEGIVLTKDGEFFEPYKLKAFNFFERETKMLDSGEVDIDQDTPEVSE